jgi:hypothetical protein
MGCLQWLFVVRVADAGAAVAGLSLKRTLLANVIDVIWVYTSVARQ